MENKAVVRVENVIKSYDDGRIKALRGVTLEIPRSSFFALAGPSGSGKTTLLNLIGALDVPDSGKVVVGDQHLEELNETERTSLRREKIGFIFQQFNLVPVLTASENVELPLEILPGYNSTSRKSASHEMLALVGLAGMEDRLPSKLSGGQQQRVAIARALIKKPALVLADEPTANLDSETGIGIIELMKFMRDELGTAFILSTHDNRVLDRAEIRVDLVDGRISDEG